MNSLFALVLAFAATTSFANIDSNKIRKIAKELAQYSADAKEYQVSAASAKVMMKELSFGELQMEDFYYDVEASLRADEYSWGIIKISQAVNWIVGSEYVLENRYNNPFQLEKIVKLFKSLEDTGVVFGAGPFGAVQCGITFPALLIMDTEAGLIYSFKTESSGC